MNYVMKKIAYLFKMKNRKKVQHVLGYVNKKWVQAKCLENNVK